MAANGALDADQRFAPFARSDLYTRPLSIASKIRLYVLTLLVLPVKLLLCLSCLVSFYFCCVLASVLPTAAEAKTVALLGKLHTRACLFCLGFVFLQWKKVGEGRQHAESEKPACIVSNHLGWPDILLHMSRFFPSFVARQGTEKIALVGLISQRMQCIYVERENKATGTPVQGTAARVKEHVLQCAADTSGRVNPMCLFAEGTTTNGRYLLPFKTGAFLAGKAVQPVIITYGQGNVSPCWETIGALEHLHYMLAEPFHSAVCYELPVYCPSQEEAADPKLFAENVRQHMLKYSKLEGSSSTLEDKRAYHSLLKAAQARQHTAGGSEARQSAAAQ